MSNRDAERAKEKGTYQWRTNPERGESFILYRWSESVLNLRDGTKTCVFKGWRDAAFIYKARKGARWVYQSVRTGKTQGFHDIRTAMRMAILLTQLENQK